MEFADFKGIHKGEEVICIGNGPSLDNVSIDFLRSRPSFGLNYLTTYNDLLDGFLPTYWLALDRIPMEVIPTLPHEMPKFVPERQHKTLVAEGVVDGIPNVVMFRMGDMGHPGGMGYGTSLLAAAHIAGAQMEAKRIFLVGFDCAKAAKSIKPFVQGKSGCPHFYDPEHEGRPMNGWCNSFGIYDKWLRKQGGKIINLSYPTHCKSLDQGLFLDYMEVS
jgi:hypothetical protein